MMNDEMSEHETTIEVAEPQAKVAGLVAQFDGEKALLAAAASVRQAGYRDWDTHSPYPVHGIERAMGIRPTILPWLVLGAGITGGLFALWLQWWTNGVDYPIITSGKPYLALPANIPIAFELVVLFSALTAFGGVLLLNRLPQFSHPTFTAERFARVTTDGFFVSIEASDPEFDADETRDFLESLEPVAVETCYAPTTGTKIPSLLIWAVAVLAALSLIPPLWIARTRLVTSDITRIRIFDDMVAQPKFLMQQANPLFADGRAMRPPVAGTVARGEMDGNEPLYQGKRNDQWVTGIPIPVTRSLMARGQEQYNTYCAPCHGLGGDGDGIVSQRATRRADPNWVPPLSLHVDTVRDQADGQLFSTITHGVRKMPAYGAQIAVADRWAIVLYVRALERSQRATLEDVPKEVRDQIR
jgi:mono/diheme cytochrome c family protein